MEFNCAVFIGRFQPFHIGHLEIAKHGLKIARNLVFVVGSSNSARNIKNPFTFEERRTMILSCFTPAEQEHINVQPVDDFPYNDDQWVKEVRDAADVFGKTALLGHFKDKSSYYLNYFPDWKFTPVEPKYSVSATDVRQILFEDGWAERTMLDTPVENYINDWIVLQKTGFDMLRGEYEFIKNYKEAWKDAPYAPTFVTTDAVVTCNYHILCLVRKYNPGIGRLALPGGFLNPDERLQDGMIRELIEETGIKVPRSVLESRITARQVFDHPGRSLRGRTITHAFLIELQSDFLPEIEAADDAEFVKWIPLSELHANEKKFYEDHFQIIKFLVPRKYA